jgi:hypothetical protein
MQIFLVACGVALVFIVAYRTLLRKQSFKGREPLTFEDIYRTVGEQHHIQFTTFAEVYKALGDCYAVDPRLIRPSDSLKKLFDIDSWDLGEGTYKMETWLAKTFGEIRGGNPMQTVLDLLVRAEANRQSPSASASAQAAPS